MIFTSPIFLFWFLPAVLITYYVTPERGRTLILALASYFFYGWWRVDFLLLLLASTVVDFLVGRALSRLPAGDAAALGRRRVLLAVSVAVNLGLLGYFKYMNFGVDSLNAALAAGGLPAIEWPAVILPIGISFYTFQTMSYTIDVYRGTAAPARRFVDFACYVSMFPQLVAGPIVRYNTIASQLVERSHTFIKFGRGAFLFQLGFAKKVLLADSVAVIADGAYALPDPSMAEAWLGTLAYAFQIYFDFSGYSDMAIGLGLMFGFTLPVNFDSPYKAASITEFWSRWHISLSTWLRDYLYVPLGGNRHGSARTYRNLMVTMLLGGLWHGAAWNFVAWGAYHGAWLGAERQLGKRPLYARAPVFVRRALTFGIVLVGYVLFRATTLEQGASILGAFAGVAGPELATFRLAAENTHLAALVLCPLLVWLAPNSMEIERSAPAWVKLLLLLLFPLALAQTFFVSYSPFLYFRF